MTQISANEIRSAMGSFLTGPRAEEARKVLAHLDEAVIATPIISQTKDMSRDLQGRADIPHEVSWWFENVEGLDKFKEAVVDSRA